MEIDVHALKGRERDYPQGLPHDFDRPEKSLLSYLENDNVGVVLFLREWLSLKAVEDSSLLLVGCNAWMASS